MQDLGVINDLIEILETQQGKGIDSAINLAKERGFVNIERLKNNRFNLDALRDEINTLQHRIDCYDQRGYFPGGTYGLVVDARDIEKLHAILNFLRNP
jgi:hypothetical protein